MAENDRGRTPSAGSGRTATLLNRLVQCGRCGRPMEATNRYGSGVPRYACDPAHKAVPGARCQSVAAPPIDRLIEALILGAVEPAALDLSLRAAEQAGRDRDRVHAAWRQKLERAAYEADRARRQYTAAEPEHRLVVRELERRWEDALAAARQVEEDYARFRADQPPELSAADRARIRSLATDLPGLWAAPTTGAADRREVVRLLLDAVEVSRQRGTEVIGVTVRWRGGAVSRHTVRQHLRGYADLGRRDELFARVRALAAAGETSHEIAEAVNAEGFVMPRGDGFTRDAIRRLIRVYRLGERSFGPSPGPDEWWLPDLCSALGVPRSVVYRWRRCGYVRTRQRGGSQTQWIIWADAPEVRRLRRLRAFEDAHRGQPPPVELTAPRSGPRGRGKRGGPSSGPTGGK